MSSAHMHDWSFVGVRRHEGELLPARYRPSQTSSYAVDQHPKPPYVSRIGRELFSVFESTGRQKKSKQHARVETLHVTVHVIVL